MEVAISGCASSQREPGILRQIRHMLAHVDMLDVLRGMGYVLGRVGSYALGRVGSYALVFREKRHDERHNDR